MLVCAGLGLGSALAVFNTFGATKVPDDELIQMSLKQPEDLDLYGYGYAQDYTKQMKELSGIAKKAAEVQDFDGVLGALADLGSNVGTAGGIVILQAADSLGGKSPFKSESNLLKDILNEINQIDGTMKADLQLEGEYVNKEACETNLLNEYVWWKTQLQALSETPIKDRIAKIKKMCSGQDGCDKRALNFLQAVGNNSPHCRFNEVMLTKDEKYNRWSNAPSRIMQQGTTLLQFAITAAQVASIFIAVSENNLVKAETVAIVKQIYTTQYWAKVEKASENLKSLVYQADVAWRQDYEPIYKKLHDIVNFDDRVNMDLDINPDWTHPMASDYKKTRAYCVDHANALHTILSEQINTVDWVVFNAMSDALEGYGDKNYTWHIQKGGKSNRQGHFVISYNNRSKMSQPQQSFWDAQRNYPWRLPWWQNSSFDNTNTMPRSFEHGEDKISQFFSQMISYANVNYISQTKEVEPGYIGHYQPHNWDKIKNQFFPGSFNADQCNQRCLDTPWCETFTIQNPPQGRWGNYCKLWGAGMEKTSIGAETYYMYNKYQKNSKPTKGVINYPNFVGHKQCSNWSKIHNQFFPGEFTPESCNQKCLENSWCKYFTIQVPGQGKWGNYCKLFAEGCERTSSEPDNQDYWMYNRTEPKDSCAVSSVFYYEGPHCFSDQTNENDFWKRNWAWKGANQAFDEAGMIGTKCPGVGPMGNGFYGYVDKQDGLAPYRYLEKEDIVQCHAQEKAKGACEHLYHRGLNNYENGNNIWYPWNYYIWT